MNTKWRGGEQCPTFSTEEGNNLAERGINCTHMNTYDDVNEKDVIRHRRGEEMLTTITISAINIII